MPSRKFMTVKEVCDRFCVSRSTLATWVDAGRLRPSKFGRAVRFSLDEIERCEREARGEDRVAVLAAEVATLPEDAWSGIVARRLGVL